MTSTKNVAADLAAGFDPLDPMVALRRKTRARSGVYPTSTSICAPGAA